MRRHVTIAIGIVLSIALLFYALRDVSAAELLRHMGEANPWLLIAAAVVATLTFPIRALRWRILLLPTKKDIPFASRNAAVCIGFMVNNVLPARVGEFARAYSLSRIEPVSVSAVLASQVVERLLDALVLVMFVIPALLLGSDTVAASGILRSALTVMVVFVSVGLITLGILVRFPQGFLRFAGVWTHRLGPDRLADGITGILNSFVLGLGALRHGHVFLKALVWSVVVWGWNGLSFYLGFLAFGIVEPGIPGALLLQTVIGFAVALPSTPGFFGPFEAAARAALELYNIAPARIVSFAAGYHILTFLPITLLGIWYMRRLGITRDELGHSAELAQAEEEGPDVGAAAAETHEPEGASTPSDA